MPTNGLASSNDLRLIIACFLFWFYSFGLLMVAVEATNRSTAVFLVAAPVATFFLIKKFSVPPVSDEMADEVLGPWRDMLSEVSLTTVTTKSILTDKSSKSKDEPHHAGKEDRNGRNHSISVWAHRFAGLDAPENTLEALETCLKNGAKAVEFDVVLTADLVPVVFHDCKLDRLADCESDIRHLPWSQVKTFDVSRYHPFRSKYPNARIPTFEDVIKICIAHKTRMVIDMKDDRIEAVNAIVDAFRKNPEMYKLALCSSFNPFIVWNIRKTDPSIVTGLTYRPYYMTCSRYSPIDNECVPYPLSAPVFYAYRLVDHVHRYLYDNLCHSLIGFSVALLEKDLITREVIHRWKKQNVRVMAWTVNIPLEKSNFMKNYGIPIITDSMLGTTDTTQ